MSPLMNSALNQVLSVEPAEWPEIQWSAAFRIGASSTHDDGTACTVTVGRALLGAAPGDAAIAIPGASPAAAATATAATSLYLLTGSSSSSGRSGQITKGIQDSQCGFPPGRTR